MNEQAKITREIKETRRYQRTADIELVVTPRQSRAEATHVSVTQTIDYGKTDTLNVHLHMNRYRKDGEPSRNGSRTVLINGIPTPEKYAEFIENRRGWMINYVVRTEFDPATAERMRLLCEQVLTEFNQIDWANIENTEGNN